MRKNLLNVLMISAMFVLADLSLTSCASRTHCPAVQGTGNSASVGGGRAKKKYCAGVNGTGNFKPKVKKKKEDGLTSKKMEKSIAKAKQKDADPIQKRKLSMDQ